MPCAKPWTRKKPRLPACRARVGPLFAVATAACAAWSTLGQGIVAVIAQATARLLAFSLAMVLCACSVLPGSAGQGEGLPSGAATPAAAGQGLGLVTASGASGTPAKPVGAAIAVTAKADNAPASAPATAASAEPVPAALDPAVLRSFEIAVMALQAGKTADAQKGFLALTRSNPELGGPHANLGILYRHSGKLDQAVAELELAVQANPKQSVYWNQLGIAYRQQGHFAQAQSAYEKAIAIDPNYPSPKLNLGVLFDLYLWDGTRALEQYERYLALTPGGDVTVTKWVADLKNRTRRQAAAKGGKEQE